MDDGTSSAQKALNWIKSKEGQKELIDLFAHSEHYSKEDTPVTLFMAGSPGAGKTEVSKNFMKAFAQQPVRIDADEIRAQCPGYNGKNSSLFQECATKGVNILHDHCLDEGLSMILDGTFAYSNVFQNIERSLKRGRKVTVWFIYQDPIQAWKITQAREMEEGRRVPMEVFIKAYFKSQDNVNHVKKHFGEKVTLNFVFKNFEDTAERIRANIEKVDALIPARYTEETLRSALLELTPLVE